VRTYRSGGVGDIVLETSKVRGWWGGGVVGAGREGCLVLLRESGGWAGHTGGKWRDSLKEGNVVDSEKYRY